MTMRSTRTFRGLKRDGSMNKTEEAYASVLEGLKQAGQITWYKFEALKVKLADRTYYTPDFLVMRADGLLEMHEVKGGIWQDDARVKIKVAAEQFPFRFVAVKMKAKKAGGGWEYEEF